MPEYLSALNLPLDIKIVLVHILIHTVGFFFLAFMSSLFVW